MTPRVSTAATRRFVPPKSTPMANDVISVLTPAWDCSSSILWYCAGSCDLPGKGQDRRGRQINCGFHGIERLHIIHEDRRVSVEGRETAGGIAGPHAVQQSGSSGIIGAFHDCAEKQWRRAVQ